MFKTMIKDSKFMKSIFESISSLVSEARLKIDPKVGLTLAAMDASHICLVSLTLKKEDFDEFQTDAAYDLGINLEDLVKVLKRAGTADQISFSYASQEKRLIIEMKPENAKKARKFTITLIDIDVEEVNLDTLNAMEFENTCKLSVNFIDEAMKDAEIFSEVLQIKSKDKLIFSTEGTIGDCVYELEKDELTEVAFKGETDGNFAIQFLKSIFKVATVSKEVSLNLKSESPLKMVFALLKTSSVMFFLAPRVEEESEVMNE